MTKNVDFTPSQALSGMEALIEERFIDNLYDEDKTLLTLLWLEQDGDNEPFGFNEPYEYAINIDTNGDIFAVPGDSGDGWILGEAVSPLN